MLHFFWFVLCDVYLLAASMALEYNSTATYCALCVSLIAEVAPLACK